MSVDDHGLEALRKAALEIVPGDKAEYLIRNLLASADGVPISDTNPLPTDTVPSVSVPSIFNLSMPSANTEYSQAIPDGTRQMLLRCRPSAKMQISFAAGQTNSNYVTVLPGVVLSFFELNTSNLTIYIRSNQGPRTAEILAWS